MLYNLVYSSTKRPDDYGNIFINIEAYFTKTFKYRTIGLYKTFYKNVEIFYSSDLLVVGQWKRISDILH